MDEVNKTYDILAKSRIILTPILDQEIHNLHNAYYRVASIDSPALLVDLVDKK